MHFSVEAPPAFATPAAGQAWNLFRKFRAQELLQSFLDPSEHQKVSKWCRRNIERFWLFYSSSDSDVPNPAGHLWTSGGYIFVGVVPPIGIRYDFNRVH